MNDELQKYRKKFSVSEKFKSLKTGEKFACAIVIPCFAESGYLPQTLESLAQNDSFLLKKSAVIVVVNRPRKSQTDADLIKDNSRTIEFVLNKSPKNLNIFIVEEFDGNLDLIIEGGVGEARKIGMDIALEILDHRSNPFIASLDADTTVEGNYLQELFSFFNKGEAYAAVIDFSHSKGDDESGDKAIAVYERYLKYYADGLTHAGSPYAFHTIGSAMALTPLAYVRVGGMKMRQGGEDFYFLQALRKTGKVERINSTRVHPSARFSSRVPFGTGISLQKISNGNGKIFNNPLLFELLREFFTKAEILFEKPQTDIEEWANGLDSEMSDFLRESGFASVWPKIVKNTPDNSRKRKEAFHSWFDAFMTLKFIHFCEDKYPAKFARLELQELNPKRH